MPVFTKKPVQVIAYNFDGTLECLRHIEILFPEIQTMSIDRDSNSKVSFWRLIFNIKGKFETPIHSIKTGDWIVKETHGYMIYKSDDFTKTYDLVG